MLGALTKKGTCITGVWDSLPLLQGRRCDGSHVHEQAAGRTPDGAFASLRTQEYPDKLNAVLAWGGRTSLSSHARRRIGARGVEARGAPSGQDLKLDHGAVP